MQNVKIKMQNYNSKFKIFIVLAAIGYWLLAIGVVPVFADKPGNDDFVYLFHLYYDNDRLFADRDFEFKYDIIPEKFVPEAYKTQFPFQGEIVNFKSETAAEFFFDPRGGDPNFLKGRISVKAPYIPDGQKAVFYDSQGNILLTIFVSESSFCDDDGACNFERGESAQTCPNDCAGITPTLPPPDGEGGGGQNSVLAAIIYSLIIIGVVSGAWYGWRRYRENKKLKNLEINKNTAETR